MTRYQFVVSFFIFISSTFFFQLFVYIFVILFYSRRRRHFHWIFCGIIKLIWKRLELVSDFHHIHIINRTDDGVVCTLNYNWAVVFYARPSQSSFIWDHIVISFCCLVYIQWISNIKLWGAKHVWLWCVKLGLHNYLRYHLTKTV